MHLHSALVEDQTLCCYSLAVICVKVLTEITQCQKKCIVLFAAKLTFFNLITDTVCAVVKQHTLHL